MQQRDFEELFRTTSEATSGTKISGDGARPSAATVSAACRRALAKMIHATAAEIFAGLTQRVHYKIGTVIELPRAAVCAGPISRHVSFISFGTNDLTQMTYGFSRDDARNYLDSYLEQGILKVDPFVTIDREGVGHLMEMAIQSVRTVNPNIKIGVCGEHGGDPESINFIQSLGVDYVSCSCSRLRVAQLAAAQAGQPRAPQAHAGNLREKQDGADVAHRASPSRQATQVRHYLWPYAGARKIDRWEISNGNPT
jgi:pyruvate,orthophosphate dikinase